MIKYKINGELWCKENEKIVSFLNENNIKCTLAFKAKKRYFADDKNERNVLTLTIKRSNIKVSFNFGDSMDNTTKNKFSTVSEIIECLLSDYIYGAYSYKHFLEEFSYEHNKENEKMYRDIQKNSEKIDKIFNSYEIEKLENILRNE